MRTLATFCAAFAAGIVLSEYLLPVNLLPYAAAGCFVFGTLWARMLRGKAGRRAMLIGVGLSLALCWDYVYRLAVFSPWESMAGTAQTLTLEAADYPAATDSGGRVEVRVLGRGLRGRALCYGDAELLALEPGMRLSGTVNVASSAVIRGEAVSTLTARGVFALLYLNGQTEIAEGNRGAPRYLPQRLARRMEAVLAATLPEQTRPLLCAILLGDRYSLSEEDESSLSEAGLLHITAVSGLHCAFLLLLFRVLIGRRHPRLLSAAAIPALLLYALTAGLTPSVARACLMLTLALLAPLFGRESDAPTSVSFALFLLLAQNPFAAKSVSLQLSFAAVAGLLWLTPRIDERLSRRVRTRAGRFVSASLAATAGSLAFTAPLTAGYFNLLVLAAPLSNLLCLWAAPLAFVSGLATALLGMISLSAARLPALAAHGSALYLLAAARLVARLPYHAVYFTGGALRCWLVYVYALPLACRFLPGMKRRCAAAGLLSAASLALALWLNALPLRSGALHIAVLDVGQGQCVALYSSGKAALVDCGSKSRADAGGAAADYLLGAGVDTLDEVVISHYHADHCNGLSALLARLRVRELVLPDIEPEDPLRQEVLALAERHRVPVRFARRTERLALGEAVLTVFPPLTEGDMNEECLTALCTAGSFDLLLTGDMDANTEYRLIVTHSLPDVEVLLAGHHGSRYSTGGDLLAEVKPETAVVSCGANNSYGHPHAEALERLSAAGAAVYRTDLQGTIQITVNTDDSKRK